MWTPKTDGDVAGTQGGVAMAWDFSTEPEFGENLEWMRGFVWQEWFPLEAPVLRSRHQFS